LGNREQALAIASDLIAAESANVTAWSLLGEVYLARGDYAASLVAYTRLSDLAPNSRAYLLGMLALHQAKGDLVTASAYAVRLERSVEEGRSLPAYALRRLRDYYRSSHEPNRALDQEAALVALYERELAELEQALAGEQHERAPKEPPSVAPEAASPMPQVEPAVEAPPPAERVPISAEERARLERATKDLFGFDRLLPGQAETMATIMRGQDVLTILPTGGGKSLCYQLPAFLDARGTTLVISPLIALMKDQVDSLPAAVRPKATTINSALEGDELRRRLQQVAHGGYRLVYAAPERLRQPPFLHALRRAGVNRLVIDEAHCVSVWGHDFRPDYLYIGRAREALGSPPLLAMTATAPPRVRKDILQRIGKPLTGSGASMAIVVADVDRPNLYFEAIRVRNADEKMRHLLTICRAEAGSGIVYVNSRARSEELADLLSNQGVVAGYYHAGMGDGAVRSVAQDAFMNEEVRVMVATVAFGMGIDKADIRFILHYDLPSSLEAYYQEAGRAGRDGLPARCVVLYAPADRGTLTLRAKRDALPVELLRDVYAAVKRRLEGETVGALAMGDLARDVQAEDTPLRVALSMLEEAGLLRRHQDAPRTALVGLGAGRPGDPRLGDDPALSAFIAAARLCPGETLPLDLLQVAREAGLDPVGIEEQVLAWVDAGWLSYRPAGRDLLLELLPPPADASAQVEALLDRYATIQVQRIEEIVSYAKTRRCRHGHISAYLSGQAAKDCRACDICMPRPAGGSGTSLGNLPGEDEQIKAILRCAATAPWSWGRHSLIRILRGDPAAPERGRESACWGALTYRSEGAIGRLLDWLVSAGMLSPRRLENGGTVLDVTPAGRAALADATLLAPLAPAAPPTPTGVGLKEAPSEAETGPIDQALLERLRAWRREAAQAAGVPPYFIAHDSVLRCIAAAHPKDEAGLRRIKGIGPKKLAKYGKAILEIVRHAERAH
jgi:ATP-dependent DNA helicase RecQ